MTTTTTERQANNGVNSAVFDIVTNPTNVTVEVN